VSIASAGLRDGTGFGQFAMRMRRTAAIAVVNDLGQVPLRWRHRFIINRWGGRCPAGTPARLRIQPPPRGKPGKIRGWRLSDPARAGSDAPAPDRKCRLTPGSLCCTPDKRRGL
jgi:hypothetical protein